MQRGSQAASACMGRVGGKVVLKKGLKKGTYKLKVKVSAAGNETHLPGSCTVTLKMKVR